MKTRILVSLTLVTVIGFSATSFAEGGNWGKHHPRREQVNDRLARQNHRINKEVKEGEMSKSEAAQYIKTITRSVRKKGICPPRTMDISPSRNKKR